MAAGMKKLGLLLSPDLRKIARQLTEADESLRRAEGRGVARVLTMSEVQGEIEGARSKLGDALESLTGRRRPG